MANNEEMRKNTNCMLRSLTRTERYQLFRKELNEIKEELRIANVPGTIEQILIHLETMMEYSVKERLLDDIRGQIADVNRTICSVCTHDCPRSVLVKELEGLLERVDEILAEELTNESAEKLRQFFLQCAENAEAIANLVDINKVLG